MSMIDLFWLIFNANDELELKALVNSHPVLKESRNWYPYGGDNANDRSNFSTFENQQPEPIPALVEKITNSIDAMLIKECLINQIDPESPDAPATMKKAVEHFYKIKNGDISELTKKEKRSFAENIQVVASGSRQTPNILIYDDGVGQEPNKFPSTFLSLRKSNKAKIKFVQGVYNMGSTGAVVFCGDERFQLIGSKLNSSIKGSHEFGFTLVRRNPLLEYSEEEAMHSWYEYLLVDQKTIPRFSFNSIDLGLWERDFTSGSIVKLYSYQLPRGSRSDIERDMWRDLNQFLYDPALPILLYDTRYRNKTPTIVMAGNRTRIINDDRDKIEKTIPITFVNQEIGSISMEATVFNHSVNQREFIKEKALVFTLNGQVQGSEPRRFITSQLGLPMLKNHMLLSIDCTNINRSFRQDLFMANRFNLKKGNKYEQLISAVTSAIKESEQLTKLNKQRREQIIHDDTDAGSTLTDLINTVPLDKEFISILNSYGALGFINKSRKKHTEPKSDDKTETAPYVSKRFPSIFKHNLKENSEGRIIKSIPLNGKGIIKFETDVEDEYFVRPKDKGELKLLILGPQEHRDIPGPKPNEPNKIETMFDVTTSGPTNNSIKISLSPNKNCSVGDTLQIKAKLSDIGGEMESIFYVKIVDPHKESTKKKKENDVQYSLPQPIRVYKEKKDTNDISWGDFDWTAEDVVKIIPFSDKPESIEAIAINMDAFVLTRYLSARRIKAEKTIKYATDKYFINVYFHALFLYSNFNNLNKQENNLDTDIEELISNIFKSYSTFLVYMDINDKILSSLEID